jgi:DUF1680 family protein
VRIRVPNRSVSDLYSSTPDSNGITSLAVNGSAVKPAIEKGYAVITRSWKAGDKIEVVLPMIPQRIRANEKIAATRNKVALRYGPLVYNIEKVDQDITKPLGRDSALSTEFRKDLLGGVTVIKGKFADGSNMTAIPNYARVNREPAAPPTEDPGTFGRRSRGPVTSIVWIKEG